jgi:hypothetical protein
MFPMALQLLATLDQADPHAHTLGAYWHWATTAQNAGLAGAALARMIERSPHGLAVGPRGSVWHKIAASVSPNGMHAETLLGGLMGYSFCDGTTVFSKGGFLLPWVARLPRTMAKGARPALMDRIVPFLPKSTPAIATTASDALAGRGVVAPWLPIQADTTADQPWGTVAALIDTLFGPALEHTQRRRGYGAHSARVVVSARVCTELGAQPGPLTAQLLNPEGLFDVQAWSPWLRHATGVLERTLLHPGAPGWSPEALLGQQQVAPNHAKPGFSMEGVRLVEAILDPERAMAISTHARFSAMAWLHAAGEQVPEALLVP